MLWRAYLSAFQRVVLYFAHAVHHLHGIDNSQRAMFFGPQGDTRRNRARLASEIKRFVHHEADICDREGILKLVKSLRLNVIR